jgi:CRP-like cAMP-binding protein
MSAVAPLDITERMLHLRQIPVATMLSTPLLRVLAGAMHDRTYPAGTPMLKQGAPIEAMYLLTEGSLSLTRDGAPYTTMSAPQTIGFLPIVGRTDTPYDAVVTSDVRALELETDVLLELFADHFELLSATLRYFAERLYFEFKELPAELLGFPAVEPPPIPSRPTNLVERIIMFRNSSGFATANVNALASLARQIGEARLSKGTTLWKCGDPGDRVFFLVKGTIACEAPDGRRFDYGSGTGVGGVDALAGRPRWYDATAKEDLVGFWGHPEALLDLFEHHYRMAMDFVASLAKAQMGLLARKAKLGHDPLAAARDVSKLGAVKVGA